MPDYGANETDLLTGNIILSSELDTEAFLTSASAEMSAKIGTLYDLDSLTVSELDAHVQEFLKLIQVRLASGHIIMESAGGAGQDESLNAYGRYLVDLSHEALDAIIAGEFNLGAPLLVTGGNSAPRVVDGDEESAVDVFSDFTMRGYDGYWLPGTGNYD